MCSFWRTSLKIFPVGLLKPALNFLKVCRYYNGTVLGRNQPVNIFRMETSVEIVKILVQNLVYHFLVPRPRRLRGAGARGSRERISLKEQISTRPAIHRELLIQSDTGFYFSLLVKHSSCTYRKYFSAVLYYTTFVTL